MDTPVACAANNVLAMKNWLIPNMYKYDEMDTAGPFKPGYNLLYQSIHAKENRQDPFQFDESAPYKEITFQTK